MPKTELKLVHTVRDHSTPMQNEGFMALYSALARLARGWSSALARCASFFVERAPRLEPREQMRLVEVLQLGSRRQLLLVICEGERFLVGMGPESVTALTRLHSGPHAFHEPEKPRGPAQPWN